MQSKNTLEKLRITGRYLTVNLYSLSWFVLSFIVVIYFPQYSAMKGSLFSNVTGFMYTSVPGVEYFVNMSSYPHTTLSLMTIMWFISPIMFLGYLYFESKSPTKDLFNRDKVISKYFLHAVVFFLVFIYVFFKLFFGLDNPDVNPDGPLTKIYNSMHSNLVGLHVFTTIWFLAMTYSLARTIVIVRLYMQTKTNK